MFRERVPERLRLPLLLVLPFVYQCSNPLYMNIASSVVSDTGLRVADVIMCGFCSILGITVTFPVLFRLKFRFTTRQIVIIASSSIIVLSLLAAKVRFLPLLVLICFLFGCFKVWGTFECMSSMMTVISPNMHLAPFLTVVFMAVFSGVELGLLSSTVIDYFYNWRYVTYALVAVHLAVILFAVLLLRDFRFQPLMPLRGIDWPGMALWGVFLVGVTALFVYGEELEWLHSKPLAAMFGIGLAALALNIFRMNSIDAPFISPKCFGYRNIWPIMTLFFVSGVMLSSQTVLQEVMMSGVLGFPPIVTVRLCWAVLAGVVIGCLISRWGLTGLGWGYKQLTGLSLLLTTMYVAAMFFLVSPTTPLEAFFLPCFFSGIAHSLLFVVLTTYVETNTPFEHRFMMLAVLGLIRTGIASPIGNALFSHMLRYDLNRGMTLESSLRDGYGLAATLGLAALLILLASRFRNTQYITIPTLTRIYKGMDAVKATLLRTKGVGSDVQADQCHD